ncbi:hypothetical protein [Mesorhizobium sp.]|uniref:hypothetical protein n=1 Tax=Mesorhizobium sp. TaxID=1871066 RepID=UPI00257B8101|nr:hypothetical protein [Mesorhizobium sp.]
MEDRERAIGVVPDLERGFDEVMTDRAPRQLQSQPREGDCVAAGNDALLLDAQDLGQLLRVGGDKGAVLDGGRLGEAGIVGRQQVCARKRLAAWTSAMPASASSLGSRWAVDTIETWPI